MYHFQVIFCHSCSMAGDYKLQFCMFVCPGVVCWSWRQGLYLCLACMYGQGLLHACLSKTCHVLACLRKACVWS